MIREGFKPFIETYTTLLDEALMKIWKVMMTEKVKEEHRLHSTFLLMALPNKVSSRKQEM